MNRHFYPQQNMGRVGRMGDAVPAQPLSANVAPSLSDYQAKMFFVYEVAQTTTLTNGNSTNLSFTTDTDSDFFWTKFAVDDGSSEVPDVTLLIQNSSTGRNFSSQTVPAFSIAGTGQLPFILPQMTYIAKNSTITIAVNNSSGADVAKIYLSFIGFKGFKNS